MHACTRDTSERTILCVVASDSLPKTPSEEDAAADAESPAAVVRRPPSIDVPVRTSEELKKMKKKGKIMEGVAKKIQQQMQSH